jgi:interferon-induced GTP-binding protein Mx1
MNNHEQLEGYERYRQFMDRLTESNVDDYVDLPMIAVMGDTSSGKSSLLSSISLVDLPSADCLTTRCPIMLKMHNATSRSASVKVSLKDKVGAASEFAERKIGENNWSDITRAIADAQAFIIEISGKEVSRDIVSVDVYGPQCENLTLIDLPGIVRTAGKQESATLADDIQGLMNDYLKNPRCVILAVLPSNVDFHNSQILADARKVDPGTNRTIPVLTKPDLIDDGGQMSVRDVLLGLKTDSFSLGFHMVKCKHYLCHNIKMKVIHSI